MYPNNTTNLNTVTVQSGLITPSKTSASAVPSPVTSGIKSWSSNCSCNVIINTGKLGSRGQNYINETRVVRFFLIRDVESL